MIAISSGGPVLYVRCREWRPGLSPHYSFHEEKKNSLFFLFGCLFIFFFLAFVLTVFWVLPSFVSQGCLMCLACHVYYSFMRMVVSHTHLFTACGRKPPVVREKKKVSSHSLSPYCFSSDVRAVVSCELSKALMVIRCLHRREPPGRWK